MKIKFFKKNKNWVKTNNDSVIKNELDQKKDLRWQEKCYLSVKQEFDSNKISNLLDDFLSNSASISSKRKFKFLTTQNLYFSTFDYLNETILKSTANKIDLSKHLIYIVKKEEFKTNLLFFYNVLVKLIGSKITPYLLYELNFENEDKMEKGILAVAKGEVRNFNFYSFDITFSEKALNISEKEIYQSYISGFYSTYNIFHPFIHEMGHIIDYYARIPLTNRENLLTLFNNKKQRSYLNNQTKNMIINNDYNLIKNVNNENLIVKGYNQPLAAKELKKFIYFKFRNTDFNFSQDEESLSLLASLVVGSSYAKVNDKELFAEAFSKWLLTKEEDWTHSWEILNDFFIDYFIEWLKPKGNLLR